MTAEPGQPVPIRERWRNLSSKPIERHVKRQIQEQGGWERILERIASGETDLEISLTLPRPDGLPISRSFFNTLLHSNVERASIDAARVEAGSARVDHAIQVAKTTPQDRDAVQKARLVVDTDLRVAGYLDRARYGEQKQAIAVQVNVGDMHLGALRHREVQQLEPAQVLAPKVSSDSTQARETDTLSLPATAADSAA